MVSLRSNAVGSNLPSRIVRVFVVDDEPVIALTLAAILQCNGFTAQSFTDPLKALKAARSTAPDLLISDIMMPELSGMDLAIQMQSLCPRCKVLLFSGQANFTALMRQTTMGWKSDFHILAKSVNPRELLRAIREQRPQCVTQSYVADPVQLLVSDVVVP